MKIPLPQTLADFELKNISNVLDFLATHPFDNPENQYDPIIQLINIVSGVSKKDLRKCDMESIKKAYEHINKILKTKAKKPPREIKINNTVYVFEDNLSKKAWTFGRYIDAMNKSIDLKESPEYICAICYIEKDKEYGDVKLSERAELFKKEFSGEVFVNLTGFFLKKYERLMPGYLVLQLARKSLPQK